MLSIESIIGLKKLLKHSNIISMKIEMIEFEDEPKYVVQLQLISNNIYTIIGQANDLDIVDVIKGKLVVESEIQDNDWYQLSSIKHAIHNVSMWNNWYSSKLIRVSFRLTQPPFGVNWCPL